MKYFHQAPTTFQRRTSTPVSQVLSHMRQLEASESEVAHGKPTRSPEPIPPGQSKSDSPLQPPPILGSLWAFFPNPCPQPPWPVLSAAPLPASALTPNSHSTWLLQGLSQKPNRCSAKCLTAMRRKPRSRPSGPVLTATDGQAGDRKNTGVSHVASTGLNFFASFVAFVCLVVSVFTFFF